MLSPLLTGLLGYYAVLNIIAFCVFAADKRAAENGGWRARESLLILLSLLGGWISGFTAMHLLGHKMNKPDFQLQFFLATIASIVGHALLIWLFSTHPLASTFGAALLIWLMLAQQ